MVTITRMDGSVLVLNADLIETIEAVPDTVVTLTTNRKVMVREPVAVVIERVIAYQRAVRCPDLTTGQGDAGTPKDAGPEPPAAQGR